MPSVHLTNHSVNRHHLDSTEQNDVTVLKNTVMNTLIENETVITTIEQETDYLSSFKNNTIKLVTLIVSVFAILGIMTTIPLHLYESARFIANGVKDIYLDYAEMDQYELYTQEKKTWIALGKTVIYICAFLISMLIGTIVLLPYYIITEALLFIQSCYCYLNGKKEAGKIHLNQTYMMSFYNEILHEKNKL